MKAFFTSLLLLTGVSVNPSALAADITIEDAWVREAPPNVKILAAYMTINNSGEEKNSLLSVNSDCCEKIEIHQSLLQDGKAKMIQRNSILLPAETNINFEPGGLHLMLINPRKKLREGNEIELKFNFSSHESISVKANVKKVTGGETHHHMHH
jgi:copper(I)-binding protein